MIAIDPQSPVVMLCAEGIEAEMAGHFEVAATCYARAWDICINDFDSCIVAHYLARVQASPEDRLAWNLLAADFANKLEAGAVDHFYPSLYLNIGKSYEDIGNVAEALRYYRLGEGMCNKLPDDRLGNITRDGIRNGIARLRHLA